jgi:hypothetical protein
MHVVPDFDIQFVQVSLINIYVACKYKKNARWLVFYLSLFLLRLALATQLSSQLQ